MLPTGAEAGESTEAAEHWTSGGAVGAFPEMEAAAQEESKTQPSLGLKAWTNTHRESSVKAP